MGGEKAGGGLFYIVILGSPPHGRGKEIYMKRWAQTQRITPAWAGKRTAANPNVATKGDHPRMGGEKQPGTVYAVLPYGSPPRMRGKEQGAGGRMAAHGITPAQAGKGSHAAPVVGTGGITPAWAGKSLCILDSKR